MSSFDHNQIYGGSAPIDAKARVVADIGFRTCTSIQIDAHTADLDVGFDNGMKLQIFNFTSYEIWVIAFADGTVEYSNRAAS